MKMKIGFMGCGNISDTYFQVVRSFDILQVVACADHNLERARSQSVKHGIPHAYTPDELLTDPEIQLVVNLTPPSAHAGVALAALESGKHVYNEKPLATDRNEARHLLQVAENKGLRVGCAPDTFLGAGLQTCRKLLDNGDIGVPLGATAFFMQHGPEDWHPNPDFFFQPGGGPMFDVGPYYLTALVSLLGPVRGVSGSEQTSFPERTVGSGPKRGSKITVRTPTHIAGILNFASGGLSMILTSFDVWGSSLPHIEIYGSEGTLSLPDPNTFGGPVRLWRSRSEGWEDVPLLPGFSGNTRSLGVADMASAIQVDQPHRASGEMAYHVLDIMETIHQSSIEGRHLELPSTCERPEPLQQTDLKYHLD